MLKYTERLSYFRPRLKIFVPNIIYLQYYYDIGIRDIDDSNNILSKDVEEFRGEEIVNRPRFLEDFVEKYSIFVKVENLGCYYRYKDEIERIVGEEIIEEKLTKQVEVAYKRLNVLELQLLLKKYEELSINFSSDTDPFEIIKNILNRLIVTKRGIDIFEKELSPLVDPNDLVISYDENYSEFIVRQKRLYEYTK